MKFKTLVFSLLAISLHCFSQHKNSKQLNPVKHQNTFVIKLKGDSLTATMHDQPIPINTYRQLEAFLKDNFTKINKGYTYFDDQSGTPSSELADSITNLLLYKYKIKHLSIGCSCF